MSTENLKNQEAIDKLRKLVDQIDVGMLASFSSPEEYPYVVPMSRQEVDEEGNIWYLFSSESQSYKNFQSDNRAGIYFANPNAYEFLSVEGIAEVSQDQARIDKYWNKFVEVYFEKGKDDPSIRVLKIVTHNAHYWETKGNKLTNLFKVASSAITGAKIDLGKEGDIVL